MASAAPTLRTMFDTAKVAKIAIVDDGYDPPLPGDVQEADWEALRAAADEADDHGVLGAALAQAGNLPPYGDLRTPLAALLFDHLLMIDEAGPPEAGTDAIYDALDRAFRAFKGRKAAKRTQLSHVEAVAREATGAEPDKLPSNTSAADLAAYDLVFLDFFLGEETTDGHEDAALLEAARAQARKIVQDTFAVIGDARMPLFVLISSRADPDTVPVFRDEAKLLASKFRFLTKGEFNTDRPKTEWVLANLVRERDAGDAVEKLLREWELSIKLATDDLMKSVRRLDVTDYAYLQKFRLADEKVSLLEYLTWLFNSYLGSFVEARLAQSPAALVEPIKTAPVPPAMLQPMSEVPAIYSAVTMTQVKAFKDAVPAPILTGDIFVNRHLLQSPANDVELVPETEGAVDAAVEAAKAGSGVTPAAEAEGSDGNTAVADEPIVVNGAVQNKEAEPTASPDILAAITPVCDLIPGRVKAKSIILMGGTLSVPGKAKDASSHLLSLPRPGAALGEAPLPFQIDWDRKWPVAHPITAFDGDGILGTDYVRVGRLRDLYAADLAQQMSGDLSRVGLPIAPPFTHPLQVAVIVRVSNKIERLFDGPTDEMLAWELYSKKSGEKREALIAVDLIWKLRDAAAKMIDDATDPCRQLLSNPEILRPLTEPFDVKFRDKTEPTSAGEKIVVVRDVAPAEDAIKWNNAVVLIHLSGPHSKGE